MALRTSLAGRVRNTSLPKSHALLPLLEAVVNGLQSIDERFGDQIEQGRLKVTIQRNAQQAFDLGNVSAGRPPMNPIVGFIVEDNGVGFTSDNMRSFETLDSDHKAEVGSRGVGRLLWLKAFDRVTVRSGYANDEGELASRQFRFSVDREVEQEPPDGAVNFLEPGAAVHLDRFRDSYQRSAPKSVESVARAIFEHSIWYFLRPGGGPKVVIVDQDDSVSFDELLEAFVFTDLPSTKVDVKGREFEMVNLCLKSSTRNSTPRLYWCAANRVVVEESLSNKVRGLYGRLRDAAQAEFTYVCYLSSPFLDENVRSDRTAFDLDDLLTSNTLGEDISLEEIRAAVLEKVEEILAEPLERARGEGEKRVADFVSTRAPRYRPVLSRLESLGVSVDPSMKDAELELILHRNLQTLEADTIAQGHAVFADNGLLSPEEQQAELNDYLDTITDINQSDLAAYVSRRRVILDVLRRAISTDGQGKYAREEAVHSLLMPMRSDSDDLGQEGSNLWILDERLAFHDYLASDRTLRSMPITGATSTKEPDILATRLVDSPLLATDGKTTPMASIVVVELKRPMRNDAGEGKDPIAQTLDYVSQVRSGGLLTRQGRPVSAYPDAPAFCYIVADLTPTMVARCQLANLKPTHDGQGYFGFNDPFKAYIEVTSFDRLLEAATERNRAFFDRLGLPSA